MEDGGAKIIYFGGGKGEKEGKNINKVNLFTTTKTKKLGYHGTAQAAAT